MTSIDANSLLMGGGIKSVNWKDNPVGHTVIGTITETPKVEQMKKFNSDELDFWPSGDPKMQIIVTLQTDQRDPANADDDGKRRLHISPRMMTCVREAILKVGAKGLEIGGRLAVQRVGGTGAVGDPYTFAAEYGAPTVDPGGLLGGGQGTPAAAPVSAAAQSLGISTPPAATAGIACPPGMDPGKWAALPVEQQRAISAAMAPQPATPGVTPPF
ncbi:hypothetical protein [Micromonospora sp. WMMD980]|uniref:hypothetical protein n=1 Tax=Micromonospora sp. WMMD980 TaxID=3016088 RepID=UPI00241731F1|nr:hypothetical protein [Micromonospora sp. WMMD980]MDG4798961.1 hypothetical protein [Micromonospora sp. WMMD980]MDG4798966.1 hypothetical protein [Micromonospora sp. WMMD980]MDG4799027.1 hypothetical protein [Micromonospora sp. WMMD980]